MKVTIYEGYDILPDRIVKSDYIESAEYNDWFGMDYSNNEFDNEITNDYNRFVFTKSITEKDIDNHRDFMNDCDWHDTIGNIRCSNSCKNFTGRLYIIDTGWRFNYQYIGNDLTNIMYTVDGSYSHRVYYDTKDRQIHYEHFGNGYGCYCIVRYCDKDLDGIDNLTLKKLMRVTKPVAPYLKGVVI